MKLLIVDDSALVRRSIENVYRGAKFTDIRTASDGLLAVTLYKEFAPDVVTLDITMPYMDGLAALSEMLEFNNQSQILIISALADHHTAIEALKRGATQFICKPFTDEDLKEALEDLILSRPSSDNQTQDKEQNGTNERSANKQLLEKTRIASSKVKEKMTTSHTVHPAPEDYPSGYVAPPSIGQVNGTPMSQPQPIHPPKGHPSSSIIS